MAITPNDILSKTFERSFRGYDEDQVDEFLDALKEEIERINEENHLLMSQIMNLEEEIQTHKMNGGSASFGESDSLEDAEMAKAGIASAKATALRIISDAKESAENIIQAANKKATEAMTKIESERKRLGSSAASADGVNLDDAALSKKSSAILEQAKMQANALLAQAKSQAEEQAKRIVENAEQKAAASESNMDSQMAGAKQQLESIQNAVKAYKTKLESFINGQPQAFKGFNPNVPGFDPGELNIAKAPEAPQMTPTAPETVQPKTAQQSNIYQPYKASENDKGYADDLKFSDYGMPGQTKIASTSQPAGAQSAEQRPTVSNIISSNAAKTKAPEPEPPAVQLKKRSDDDSDERYRQVLNQIRSIEKTKDELKSHAESAHIDSVNPVKDMTDKVEPIKPKSTGKPGSTSVIISEDDEFVGKISAADPIAWDEPVPMSDEEKRHLREMLDDML